MKKQTILETVNAQPNEVNLDELIEKLIFMEKVEKGLKEIEEGKAISHDDVAHHFNNKSIV
jgi:hypothetical protein